jgi:galactokinase
VPGNTRASAGSPPPREVRAFAPGRVNLIGEHTDYNGGLALPFAIAEGVTVRGRATSGPDAARGPELRSAERRRDERVDSGSRVRARALDLAEDDEFELARIEPASGWRAFVRGAAAELAAAGVALPGAALEIRGDVARGAGLSSSAALAVAVASALLGVAGAELDRLALAELCSRVENEWVGARTGLLDQLASLFGRADAALLIDFQTLEIEPVPLVLVGRWRLVTLDSGERHDLATAGYNERRAECARACELLGVDSLRELERSTDGGRNALARLPATLARLPDTLARRVRHVVDENARVLATVAALRAGDLARVGALLDASHVSLREQYECSTPAVEATVERLKNAGAAGARMVGGGFGGSVLALFSPDAMPPPGTHDVRPSRGAHLLG